MTTPEEILEHSRPRHVDAAAAAKILRRTLRARWPAARFSVRTSRYSGGSSVDVRWTDGPSTHDVESISGPFAGGGFDGMIDMSYSVSSWLLPDGTAAFAATSGTQGSRGSVPAAIADPPEPGAELVHFGCTFCFAQRDYSDRAQARIRGYVERHLPEDWWESHYWRVAQATTFDPDGRMTVPHEWNRP